jgi:hypothetical protein
VIFAAMSLSLLASAGAHAQSAPDTDNGRYTLSPVAGDFLRLDTRTGAVSTCSNRGGWVCRAVPDERTALDTEIGRLQAENKTLKEQLAATSGKPEASSGGKIELQLPADHQKLMALIDRVWDRLVEIAGRVQKKLSEKI